MLSLWLLVFGSTHTGKTQILYNNIAATYSRRIIENENLIKLLLTDEDWGEAVEQAPGIPHCMLVMHVKGFFNLLFVSAIAETPFLSRSTLYLQ